MEPSPPRSPATTPAAEPRTPPAASLATTLATPSPTGTAPPVPDEPTPGCLKCQQPSNHRIKHIEQCPRYRGLAKRHASADGGQRRTLRQRASAPPALLEPDQPDDSPAASHLSLTSRLEGLVPKRAATSATAAARPPAAADGQAQGAAVTAAAAAIAEPTAEGGAVVDTRANGDCGSAAAGASAQPAGGQQAGGSAAARTSPASAAERDESASVQMGTTPSRREMQYILEHFIRLEGRSRRAMEEDAAPTGARVHEFYAVLTDGEEVPLTAAKVRAQEGGCGDVRVRAKLSNFKLLDRG